MLGFLVLLLALALGPQVVLSKFLSITFSSTEQCGPLNVTFSQGTMPSASPLSLTVVPFNSVPIFIPIPSSSWDDHTSTGAYITFLPLPAGATFIASLDDGAGNSMGAISDVIRVQSSNNTSCLPATPSQPADFFAIGGGISQCEPFKLQWNSSVTSQPPTIRAFIPKGPSFHVQQLPGGGNGQASYVLNASRGKEIAFLIDDGQGNKQDLDLFTIGGDTSSSTKCLLNNGTHGKQRPTNRNLSK
ncbi:hypothetical protein EWM64_g6755 [Hericium alpestre]|uniref:Uncharacterized protein n=1 Tax=Hericium alpestre TaxID=135208 RepID=A0A4Y9ZSQ0_9AGAM|nr:hypothetical protein EWM64_g6755 [Hericium alpestre]